MEKGSRVKTTMGVNDPNGFVDQDSCGLILRVEGGVAVVQFAGFPHGTTHRVGKYALEVTKHALHLDQQISAAKIIPVSGMGDYYEIVPGTSGRVIDINLGVQKQYTIQFEFHDNDQLIEVSFDEIQ